LCNNRCASAGNTINNAALDPHSCNNDAQVQELTRNSAAFAQRCYDRSGYERPTASRQARRWFEALLLARAMKGLQCWLWLWLWCALQRRAVPRILLGVTTSDLTLTASSTFVIGAFRNPSHLRYRAPFLALSCFQRLITRRASSARIFSAFRSPRM